MKQTVFNRLNRAVVKNYDKYTATDGIAALEYSIPLYRFTQLIAKYHNIKIKWTEETYYYFRNTLRCIDGKVFTVYSWLEAICASDAFKGSKNPIITLDEVYQNYDQPILN